MDELKPCPFCGVIPTSEEGEPNDNYERGYNFGDVCCENNECHTNMVGVIAPTSREAWNIWNTRPIEDALEAENNRLRDAMLAALNLLLDALV